MKLIAILCFLVLASVSYAQVSVSVDTTTTYQTIDCWGHGGGVFSNLNYLLAKQEGQSLQDSLDFQYIDYIASDLGLTGSRMWEVGARIDGTGIDVNGDCDSLDWSRMWVPAIDTQIAKYARRFKDLVEAQGYKTSFYSSPTYPTFATQFKPWVQYHPGERAMQIWANALWWKQQGIDINYAVIQNEPQYGSSWNTQVLSDDVAALGPRCIAHGLATKAQWAEGVDPHTTWQYDTNLHRDANWWSSVGRISYHRYGSDDPWRSYLADSARVHGISTAQTEMGNPNIDDLFSDLMIGYVTYWEVAFAGPNTLASTQGNTGWTPTNRYFRLRQVLHYVRPGDVRVGAVSSDSLVKVVAFKGKNGITTIVENGKVQQSVMLIGLRPGQYGFSETPIQGTAFQEFGVKTVGSDGKITITVAGSGAVATLYPYVGVNHPPVIQTWIATPGYVVAPTKTATLTATVSDAENDAMTYHWSVSRQPSGANAVLATPTALTTTVNGLAVAGLYIFAIDASDGINSTRRKVYLEVYDSNPSPWLWQSGFRFSAPYGLVFANPEDTTHANIELPTSSATLQVGISDVANSNFTGRGKWTIVSQPAGANAKLDTTIYIFISIRANVSNMIVPGDYVFQCNVTNPGHPDLIDRIICTVHPQSAGPTINSISATPQVVETAQATTDLSANTSDAQGQQLRHWWLVKSVPQGATVQFAHQGRAATAVSGLTVPGTYTFTLRTFDDLHMATKDVSVTVTKSSQSVNDAVQSPPLLIGAAHDRISITLPAEAVDATIQIVDLLGRVVSSAMMHSSSFELRTLQLASGCYFVTCHSNGKEYRGRFVK